MVGYGGATGIYLTAFLINETPGRGRSLAIRNHGSMPPQRNFAFISRRLARMPAPRSRPQTHLCRPGRQLQYHASVRRLSPVLRADKLFHRESRLKLQCHRSAEGHPQAQALSTAHALCTDRLTGLERERAGKAFRLDQREAQRIALRGQASSGAGQLPAGGVDLLFGLARHEHDFLNTLPGKPHGVAFYSGYAL